MACQKIVSKVEKMTQLSLVHPCNPKHKDFYRIYSELRFVSIGVTIDTKVAFLAATWN